MGFDYIGVIFLIVAAIAGIVGWSKRLGAGNWPMTVGTVEQTCVDRDNRGFVPGILYSYQVNGEFYSGSFHFREGYSDSDKAVEAARPWLKRKIYIRYKPSDPQTSVLLPSDRPPD